MAADRTTRRGAGAGGLPVRVSDRRQPTRAGMRSRRPTRRCTRGTRPRPRRRPPFAALGERSLLGRYVAWPLLVVGDDITTDHISPADAIPPDSLVADFLDHHPAVRSDRGRCRCGRDSAALRDCSSGPSNNGSTHWSSRKLAAELKLPFMTVQRIWRKHNVQPHRTERHIISNDPDFENKAADVIGLYLNPPAHAAVFCVDEKTISPHSPRCVESPAAVVRTLARTLVACARGRRSRSRGRSPRSDGGPSPS